MLQAAEDWEGLVQVILAKPRNWWRPDGSSNAGSLDFYVFPSRFAHKVPGSCFGWRARRCPSTPIKPTPCSIKAWTNSCGRAIERARYCPGAVRSGQSSTMGRSWADHETLGVVSNHPSRRCFLPLDRGRAHVADCLAGAIMQTRPDRDDARRGWTGLSVLATISHRPCKLVPGT